MNLFEFSPVSQKSVAVQTPQNAGQTIIQNLFAHIPAEASGFYLLTVQVLSQNSPQWYYLLLAIMSLVILIVVRWIANAKKCIYTTSIIAFIIWMFAFEQGVFHILFPGLLSAALWLIIAAFYSAVITILASAGKICTEKV